MLSEQSVSVVTLDESAFFEIFSHTPAKGYFIQVITQDFDW